jgi:hypothetical protein
MDVTSGAAPGRGRRSLSGESCLRGFRRRTDAIVFALLCLALFMLIIVLILVGNPPSD